MLTTGGLGKSTLINQVFTEMKQSGVFTDSKFLSFDLELECNDNDKIFEVQRWLLRRTGPVLLVLDNVQRQRQIDSILDCTDIKEKSYILLTSRRRDLVAPSDLYEMPTLRDNDAFELFRWHSQGVSSSGVLKKRSLKVCC
jgi:hypothetical protein